MTCYAVYPLRPFCIFIVEQVCCYDVIPTMWPSKVNNSLIAAIKVMVNFYLITFLIHYMTKQICHGLMQTLEMLCSSVAILNSCTSSHFIFSRCATVYISDVCTCVLVHLHNFTQNLHRMPAVIVTHR